MAFAVCSGARLSSSWSAPHVFLPNFASSSYANVHTIAMTANATLSDHEADRLAKLRELVILDSAPEPVFDAIVRTATVACGVPIALISLIDLERQWFKANVGWIGVTETPRNIAFCDHTIRGNTVLEVPDARVDARFSQNPLVTQDPNIVFYAGAPLTLPSGQHMGTLCVLDREVRHLSADQVATLRSLADIVCQTLIMRRELIERTLVVRAQHDQAVAQSERFMRQIVDRMPTRIAYVDQTLRYRFVNQAQCDRFGLSRYQILGHTRSELKPDAPDPVIASHVRAVLGGETQHFLFTETTSAGVRNIESTLIPDRLANGEVVGFFSTGVDVTDRVAAERSLRELTAIIENTTDFVTQIDRNGMVTYMNPAARRGSGIALDAPLTGVSYAKFNTPATVKLHQEVILPALERRGVWVGESVVYGAHQREIPVSHMVISHRNSLGRIERFSAVMRDISRETSGKLDALRQLNTLRSVTEAIPESVAVVGADLRYRFVNSAFERWIATPREKIIGQTMRDVLGRDAFLHNLPQLARALAGETVSFESTFDGSDGPMHLSISHAPLRVDEESVDSVVTVARDITLQKSEETRLRELSERDPLSGLLNRAGFERYLARAIIDGRGSTLTLLYIDLDYFKPVNDRYGHAVGDQVLQLFSHRLVKSVRPTDCVARLGGDEFVIVLSGVTDRAVADAVCESVLACARVPFRIADVQVQISASIGVASGANFSDGWHTLLERADAQLYKAKDAGRGRSVSEHTMKAIGAD
jgi:diguanylate cyclase (GGDEF)-like protein/PAS domain S-box-containing protein